MSTTEYVAVVLLVSIVLAVGGAQIAGVDVAEAVGRKIKVALCVVAGDDCDENGEEEACVVSSSGEASELSASVALVRAKDGRDVEVEQLSNGKYRITVMQTSGVGGGTGLSAGVKFWKWGAEAGVDGALYRQAGYERVFEVEGAKEAERLVERLDDDDWKLAGTAKGALEMVTGDHAGASEQYIEVGAGGEAEGALSALGFGSGAIAGAGSWTGGLRLNHATGERSLSIANESTLSADLGATLASVGVGGSSPRSFELRLDRDNRPVALVLHAGIEGSASARVKLPGDQLSAGASAGRRVELEAELDLTDPALRAHADELLHGNLSSLGALVRMIPTSARMKAQTYNTSEKDKGWGFSLKVPVAGEVGIGGSSSTTSAKLTGAWEHKPGMPPGTWEQDCVTVV